MLSKDRAALRNLLVVILGSTGALLVVGTTCLGRGRARLDPASVSTTAAERDSVRSSAGGVPPAPVGTTVITGAQLERGASATGSPTDEPFAEPVPHTHAAPPPPAPAPSDARPPHAPSAATAQQPSSLATPAPPATPAPSPVPTPAAVPAPAPSAAPPQRSPYRTPTEGLEAGAGQFMTEPPPFAASSMTPNREAGAGPFVTDQVVPPPAR